MSDFSYSLDATSAKSAENIGKFIRETGKYKGQFLRAELMISKDKGSRGIEFDFVADGKECTTQIWTHSGAGEPYSGNNMVCAIMACLSLRGIKPVEKVVPKYDYDLKKKVDQKIMVFPDLMNKPIGLLLQKEISEYEGKEKTKMLIFAAFDHNTEKTATEIIDRVAQPLALAKLVSMLGDKDSRKKGGGAPRNDSNGGYYSNQTPDIDDNLPF